LTANAPWKRPENRAEAEHAKLQARVLATAAAAIRVITALAYPIVPDAASKVWEQLGLGKLADAARQGFLKDLAWSGLKAGTKFGEPSPLFPRAEKEAIDRMQSLEDENNRSAVESASGHEIVAPPPKAEIVAPSSAPAATSVVPVAAPTKVSAQEKSRGAAATTPTTAAPADPATPVETAKVHQVPTPLASSRLSSTPAPADSGGPLIPGSQTGSVAPAMTEPGAAKETAQHITIDDFAKVELRVAQILVAERVPKADKLLRLEVDLGTEKRQILAGIAEYYEPEKLIGRRIVIVANLAPRKMRGLESNGMLLAASLEGGAPVLAGFLEDVPLGARLK
jgi:methionyl-tRNA synthetase